jgi:hypothetical protein
MMQARSRIPREHRQAQEVEDDEEKEDDHVFRGRVARAADSAGADRDQPRHEHERGDR